MRRKIFAAIVAFTLIPATLEAEPAIIVTDAQTSAILSSNNIDIKQDSYLTGKLAMTFIALNEVITGQIDPDLSLSYPDDTKSTFAEILKDAAGDTPRSAISMQLIASLLAQSPEALDGRMNSLFRKIGMRATSMTTVMSQQGEPGWSGYTTIRDIARLTTSLLHTHGDYARWILPSGFVKEDGSPQGVWFYRDGLCLAISSTPKSGREMVSVIQGASSEENCAGATEVALIHNDDRISDVVAGGKPAD